MRSQLLLLVGAGASFAYEASSLYAHSFAKGYIDGLEAREAEYDSWLVARDDYESLSYGYARRDAFHDDDDLLLEYYRRANAKQPGKSAPQQKASSPPGPEQYDPAKDPKRQAREQNAQLKSCKSSNDCNQYCKDKLKLPADKSTMSTCDIGNNKQGQGVCKCSDGTAIANTAAEALTAIGNVSCQVWNKAVSAGIDIATAVIPGGIAATAAEKAAVETIKGLLKAGNKSGIIDFCKKK